MTDSEDGPVCSSQGNATMWHILEGAVREMPKKSIRWDEVNREI